MTIIHKTALVKYSMKEMMALVEDIERYPEFLPGCDRVVIVEQDDVMVRAEVSVGWQGIAKKFTTHNTKPRSHQIHMSLVDGPFRHLEGTWEFEQHGDHCEVSLDLVVEFSNFIVQKMFDKSIAMGADKIFQAFCDRAQVLYGH